MADNYVEIKIKASDTAKPDLTELRADLDELGRKVETARVDVDDEEAKLKLLDMNAKLAALNKRVANPRISVSSAARAESDIAKINAEIDKLDRKAQAQQQSRGGLLGKILFGGAGDAESAAEGGGLPSIGGVSLPALVAIVPALEAALVEVTGLASGFAAAGVGAGSFAALAMPAVKSVTSAYTSLNTAMSAYDAAKAKEAASPSKANANAVKAALLNVNLAGEAIGKLPASEQGAIDGIYKLQRSFSAMSKAFEPQAFKVFNDGLKIANNLLPLVTPFANSFANSLDGLLKKAGGFTSSSGFKDWVAQFQKLTGPSTTAIGDGIGKVAVQIGKLLTTMSAKDDVHAINIAFDTLAGIIGAVTYSVAGLMRSWDQLSSAFRHTRRDIASDSHNIANAFDIVRHASADLAHNVAAHFDEIRHDTANLTHNIASYFDEARANIYRWASDVVNWVRGHWKLLAAITGPLGLAIDATVTHIRGLETAFRVAYSAIAGATRSGIARVRSILTPFVQVLAPQFSAAWSRVESVFSSAWRSISSTSSAGTARVHSVLNWFGNLASMFRRWWDSAASATSSGIARMVGFVRTIPSRINSALGNLPSMLARAGANAIQGLIRGMGSMVGSAISMAAGWGHDIANALGSAFGIHFSEPSEASKMIAAGKQIPKGLASGMLSSTGVLRSAANTVSGAAYPHAGGAGGGAGGVARIQLELVGNDEGIMRALRQAIRVKGGNVQVVLGH